jgi:hypothetical protein
VPSIAAPWALAGLYLSLGPSLAAQATGSPNLLWGGLVIFLLSGTAAAAAFALRGISSRAAMLAGCLSLLAGTALTCGAIATTTSAAFLAGTAVAGAGLGLAFLGAFRVITALATPGQRAGLVAAMFAVLYLAFSVPRADRRRRGHYVRTALHGPGLLRITRRPGRSRNQHPGVPPRRHPHPASPASRAVTPPGAYTAAPFPQAMDRADGNRATARAPKAPGPAVTPDGMI